MIFIFQILILSLHSQLERISFLRFDSVAQLVEHYTFNVGALGSNPSGITGTKAISIRGGFLLFIHLNACGDF